MLTNREYWTLAAIGVLSLVLVVANMAMFLSNRSAQAEVNARAQFIQQTVQLDGLYREIVKALADLSVKNQDKDLRALLAAHGITVNVPPPVPPSAAPETGRRSGGK